MEIIESQKNEQIKYIAKLIKSSKFRREEKAFVIEGPRMVFEAPCHLIKKVYLSESFFCEFQNSSDNILNSDASSNTNSSTIKQIFRISDFQVVSDSVMRSLSDTVTPKGILAIVSFPEVKDFLSERNNHPVIFLESLQDPGNLGTIFRTAEAAGVRGIVMSEDTVDVFSPKVTRATMGSIFRVPFVVAGKDDYNNAGEAFGEYDLESAKNAAITGTENALSKGCSFYEILNGYVSSGSSLFGAALGASHNYDEVDYSSFENGFGFLIGNEGNGLSEKALSYCTDRIIIPMEGEIESLNAAVSASILMYEAKRQRDRHSE